MSTTDYHFWFSLFISFVSVTLASCLCKISCPCGTNTNKVYPQCNDEPFPGKYTCETWAKCETCEANTNHCITCPPGFTGTLCTEVLAPSTNCPDPGSIENGYRQLATGFPSRLSPFYVGGQTYQYFCNQGYVLQGSNEITCLPSGKWSHNIPYCLQLPIDPPYCNDPGQIPYGSYRNTSGNTGSSKRYAVGDTVTYYCQHGYELVGKGELSCTPFGSWPMKPLCRKITTTPKPLRLTDPNGICPDPGSIQNGYRRLLNGFPSRLSEAYDIGHTFQFFCNEGYELQGKDVLSCLSSGQWTNSKPWCQIIATGSHASFCKFPHVNTDGIIIEPTGEKFPPGTEMKFQCENRFQLEGNDKIYCKLDGEWTSKPPMCRRMFTDDAIQPTGARITCPFPTVDPNGSMEEMFSIDPRQKRQGFEPGSQVSFTCNSGYELQGPNSIICLITGQWMADPPTCRKITITDSNMLCADPGSIQNGGVIVRYNNNNSRRNPSTENQDSFSYPEGTQLVFNCINGYRLDGERTLICGSSGRWSSDKPRCII